MSFHPEIQSILAKRRPVRFGALLQNLSPISRLDRIDEKATIAMVRRHAQWTRRVFDILPGPSLRATIDRDRRRGKAMGHGPGCACCDPEEVKTKAFGPADVERIRREFIEMMGPEMDMLLQDELGRYNSDMASRTPGAPAIWNVFAAAAVAEIIRISHHYASTRAPAGTLTTPMDPGDFIRQLEAKGFGRITHKTTRLFQPELQRLIVEGLRNGDSWQRITTTLNRRVGIEKAWHWRRLVTTEMTGAIDKVNTRQYAEAGAIGEKYSASLAACPVCAGHAALNRGYYLIGEAPLIPEDTHPSCRCFKIPVFNFPAGINL